MPIARVQVPDGRVMRLDVPEGTTPEQVEAFVSQQLGAQEQPALPQEEGVFDKYQREASEAAQNPNLVSSMAKGASAASNLGMGIFGKAVPEFAKEAIGSVVQGAAEAAQNIPGMKSYQKAWEQQPQPAKDVEQAVFDVSGLMALKPTLAGMGHATEGIIQGAVKNPTMATRAARGEVESVFPKPKMTLSEQAAAGIKAANEKYGMQSNIRFAPEVESKLVTSLRGIVPKSASSSAPYAESGALGIIRNLEKDVAEGNLDFQTLLDVRSNLNGKKFSTTDSNQARILGQVKKKIDDAMISPETGTWIEANHDFGIAATKRDLGEMVKYSMNKSQPANSLDTAINNYLMEEGGMLSKAERATLENITKNTYADDIKRGMATRLMSLAGTGIGAAGGGALGAIVGNVAGSVGSRLMRDLAFQKKYVALEKFFEQLDKRPRPKIPERPQPKQPLSLPPPSGTNFYVDNLGNASRTPNPAHEVVKRPYETQKFAPSLPPEMMMKELEKMSPYEARRFLEQYMKNMRNK